VVGFFPVEMTIGQIHSTNTGRDELTAWRWSKQYAKAQGYWRPEQAEPVFNRTRSILDLAVRSEISGSEAELHGPVLSGLTGDHGRVRAQTPMKFGKLADAA